MENAFAGLVRNAGIDQTGIHALLERSGFRKAAIQYPNITRL
ncbi:MAG TPA: hypothetical protein VE956_17300 [Nodularia sp. (in: cyanobacteria)]|nr:hypothetical protein [Nodularia sp. (in: cyanobacteria)]